MSAANARPWTAADVPEQRGRVAVVTGANSGIGFETARVLAERGATVVLACRDLDRGRAAADRIAGSASGAGNGEAGSGPALGVVRLDLASLSSVREAADQLRDEHDRIDLLINNAGVMWTPRRTTADGFELQFGTNHLGHFALTGLLLDRMLEVPGSRVVTVSSLGHFNGRMDFDDLQHERRYGRHRAYARSKLANLLFTYELQRRLAAAGAETTALAAHPGGSHTALSRNSPWIIRAGDRAFGSVFMQSAAMGALPTLRAATEPGAPGGAYFGPAYHVSGFPVPAASSRRSHDAQVQSRLWAESERLTGVEFPLDAYAS